MTGERERRRKTKEEGLGRKRKGEIEDLILQ